MIGRRPAVVPAADDLVDLLRPAAHVVRPDPTRARLHRERERVAAPQRPDRPVLAGRPVHERVVGRDRAVRVEAEDLAEERVEPLGRCLGRLLAERDVQLAVGPEVDRPALVTGRDLAAQLRLVVAFEEDLLGARLGDVARRGEPADDVVRVRPGRDVAEEDVRRLREVRGDRHADQAALPRRIDRQSHERLRQRPAVLDDAERPRLLTDEDTAVGRDFVRAHVGPPESDISFALWVAGRTEQPAVALDADRIRAFIAGYHRVRPLDDSAARAIPLYLVGRGLQMLTRLERAGRRDEIQSNRLHWLDDNRRWLEDVVASGLAPQGDG